MNINCNLFSYNRFVLVMIICSLVFGIACKKEENPFSKYEGSWKLKSFSFWDGTHNGPPGFPRLGNTYDSWNDKIINVNTWLISDSNGLRIGRSDDTFDLVYNINSKLKDRATLTISEKYQMLDRLGNVVKTLNFNNEVVLEEGKSNYGYPNRTQTIEPSQIKIYLYEWSSSSAKIEKRQFEK